jgi:hypothetical protein
MAYFEAMRVPDIDTLLPHPNPNEFPHVERFVYRTFSYRGRDPETLIRYADEKIKKIEEQACLRARAVLPSSTPIILWRARPKMVTVLNEDESTVAFGVRFRLTTIPQLTEEQWDDLMLTPESHFEAK